MLLCIIRPKLSLDLAHRLLGALAIRQPTLHLNQGLLASSEHLLELAHFSNTVLCDVAFGEGKVRIMFRRMTKRRVALHLSRAKEATLRRKAAPHVLEARHALTAREVGVVVSTAVRHLLNQFRCMTGPISRVQHTIPDQDPDRPVLIYRGAR